MDIVHAMRTTPGIYETQSQMGQLSVHVSDIGGLHGGMKKWMHQFEAATFIIFVVDLDKYDREDEWNRLFLLFDGIVKSRWFERTSIILMLNKVEAFGKKLESAPLANYFPDYGGCSDVHTATQYVLKRFNKLHPDRLLVYPVMTETDDPSVLRLLSSVSRDVIINNSLRDIHLLR